MKKTQKVKALVAVIVAGLAIVQTGSSLQAQTNGNGNKTSQTQKAPKAPANETDAQRAERLRKGREAFYKEAEKVVQPTPEQKKKINAVIGDISQKIRKTESDKKLTSAQKRERVGQLHQELYTRVLPILNAGQQAKLRELMARKHEVVERATNQS